MTDIEAKKILLREHDGFNSVLCPICNKPVARDSEIGTFIYAKSKRDKKHRFYHKKCVENQWKSGDGK